MTTLVSGSPTAPPPRPMCWSIPPRHSAPRHTGQSIRLGNEIRRLRCDTGARHGRELLPSLSVTSEDAYCPRALMETLVCSHLDALTYLRDAVREPQCGAKLQELVGRLTVVSQSMQPACGSCLAEALLSAEYQTGAELRSLNSGLLLPTTDKPAEFVRSLEPDWDRGPASLLLLLGATHLSAREWREAHAAGRDNQAALHVDDGEPRALALYSPCASSGQHETFRRCRESLSARISILARQLHNATGTVRRTLRTRHMPSWRSTPHLH